MQNQILVWFSLGLFLYRIPSDLPEVRSESVPTGQSCSRGRKNMESSRCRMSCQKLSQENLTLARTKFDEGRVLMNNFFSKAGMVFHSKIIGNMCSWKILKIWQHRWIHCFHCQIDTSVGLNPSDVPWRNIPSILSKKIQCGISWQHFSIFVASTWGHLLCPDPCGQQGDGNGQVLDPSRTTLGCEEEGQEPGTVSFC